MKSCLVIACLFCFGTCFSQSTLLLTNKKTGRQIAIDLKSSWFFWKAVDENGKRGSLRMKEGQLYIDGDSTSLAHIDKVIKTPPVPIVAGFGIICLGVGLGAATSSLVFLALLPTTNWHFVFFNPVTQFALKMSIAGVPLILVRKPFSSKRWEITLDESYRKDLLLIPDPE